MFSPSIYSEISWRPAPRVSTIQIFDMASLSFFAIFNNFLIHLLCSCVQSSLFFVLIKLIAFSVGNPVQRLFHYPKVVFLSFYKPPPPPHRPILSLGPIPGGETTTFTHLFANNYLSEPWIFKFIYITLPGVMLSYSFWN